jgi:hypothetical protein
LSLLYQISDNWRTNIKLDKTFQHQTVNYNLNFVDPDTFAHTNCIESVWNSGKIQFKSMRGVSRKFFFNIRRRNQTYDHFGACEAIVQEYPFDSASSMLKN